MVALMLAAVAGVHLVTAAAFAAVGQRFRARQVEAGLGLARDAFVVWWWGFGAYLALQGIVDLVAALGYTPLALFVAFRLGTGPLIAAAAWGLAYHILFLWSGKGWWGLPLAFYYGFTGAAYSFWIASHDPQGVTVGTWAADLTYGRPIAGPVWSAILASVGLPLVLGSIAFLALALKVHDRPKRYRIVLVGSSILLWVVSGYAAEVGGGEVLRFIAIVVLGLATAITVTAAYYPPAPVRRWLARPPKPALHAP